MPASTADPGFEQRVAAVRRFNRFYTQQIGVLREGMLGSPFSLTEVRILYELAHRDALTATELSRELDLDPGYLSRILARFRKQGLLRKSPSQADARRLHLTLTPKGGKAFAPLDRRSHDQVATMLLKLAPEGQSALLRSMQGVSDLLAPQPIGAPPAPITLRPHRPGDMGWVVHRHGVLYAREYGWDERFEALVAEIAARFVQRYDERCERCWIAERGTDIVGSVFLVRRSRQVAKLRLLLVEPTVRGHGLGARLVRECIDFARAAGYRKIMLWTNSVLHAARRIYENEGFVCVAEAPHRSFGQSLVGETWELELSPRPRRARSRQTKQAAKR